MKEEWKDIKGFEGHYQVSDLGRVRSLDREVLSRNASGEYVYRRKGVILYQRLNRIGQRRVQLCRDGGPSMHGVSRLVAEAFIPNPERLECVCTKDGDLNNLAAANLRWCTLSEVCMDREQRKRNNKQ